ncbi:MAG: hypothetical protein NTW33_00735 [Methanoregula sp.]|nr:hypothetical protein [Methanoregula sp.]
MEQVKREVSPFSTIKSAGLAIGMGLAGMHMPGINGEIFPLVPFQQCCAKIMIVFKVVPVNINPDAAPARIVGIKKSRYIIKNPVEGRTPVGEDPPGVVHLSRTVNGDLD